MELMNCLWAMAVLEATGPGEEILLTTLIVSRPPVLRPPTSVLEITCHQFNAPCPNMSQLNGWQIGEFLFFPE